eukprot:TRINITY_DN2184_c0_g1_i1.p1 TRINITY_DN2184_c0_g1~~TRINITY_DN2184_c0_g1_i1.p1  ORF type:complete len:146 (+),score=19.96 TRINITY_DN2184_c0_g1_i1:204-641(+)
MSVARILIIVLCLGLSLLSGAYIVFRFLRWLNRNREEAAASEIDATEQTAECTGIAWSRTTLKPVTAWSTNDQATICCICMDPIAYMQSKRALDCQHEFHDACIGDWFNHLLKLRQRPSCPMCKKDFGVPALRSFVIEDVEVPEG